jgi:MFS family permease
MAKAGVVSQSAWSRPERSLLAQVSSAHFVSHYHIMTLPALIPLMPNYMNVSLIDLGIALSVFNIVLFVSQTPLGFVTDKLGARSVLIFGLLLGAASFFLMVFHDSYAWLLVAMVGAGLANGVYHPADYALLSNGISPSNMGRAFSVHTFFGYIGAASAPATLLFVAAYAGIPMAFGLAGLVSLVVGLIILLSKPHTPITTINKTGGGYFTGAISLTSLLTPAVASLTLMYVALALSTYGIQDFSVTAFVTGYGVNLTVANTALTTFLFSSAFGVLAGGIFADRTSHHGYVATAMIAIAACIVLFVAFVPLPGIVLIVALGMVGFLIGAIAPSRDMLVRSITPPGAEGRIFGMVSTGAYVGAAIAPLIFASLLEAGLMRGVFIVTSAFMLTTSVITVLQELSMKRK